LSYINPKGGIGATVFVGLVSRYLGGDYDFYKAGLNVSGIIPLDQSNLIALRFALGISGNEGIPPQQQYDLGGLSAMRGFQNGSIERIGRNRVLLSAEYRHYLFKDIDINLASLFRVRNIMGALFMNTGRINASVAEYADYLAGQGDYNPSPHPLFNVNKYEVDIGYGIRFLYDILGVRESILSVDVAKSLTGFGDNGVRYYVSFAQTF
jgi:outer membrane protein assembly factor BamA